MTLVWSSYVIRPSDSEHVVPFPMQITRVHVLFTFLLFAVVLLALFFPFRFVFIPFIVPFTFRLSVCVCFHAIPCNILLVLFMFHHVSFNSFHFLACSFHFPSFTSFTSLQPVLACKPLTKGSHTYICMVRPRVQYLDLLGHILTLLSLLSFPLAISIVRRF